MTGPTVTVRGSATASAVPDAVRLTVAVECRRADPPAALAAVAEAMDRIRAALHRAGVPDEDVATPGLAVRAEEVYVEGRPPRVAGYVAMQSLVTTLRQVSLAGETAGAVVEAGGEDVRVNGLSLVVTDSGPTLATARARAWADAQARAEQLAELAGRRLGPALVIEELPGGWTGGPEPLAFAEAARAVDVSVEPGSQRIEVVLSVRWELA